MKGYAERGFLRKERTIRQEKQRSGGGQEKTGVQLAMSRRSGTTARALGAWRRSANESSAARDEFAAIRLRQSAQRRAGMPAQRRYSAKSDEGLEKRSSANETYTQQQGGGGRHARRQAWLRNKLPTPAHYKGMRCCGPTKWTARCCSRGSEADDATATESTFVQAGRHISSTVAEAWPMCAHTEWRLLANEPRVGGRGPAQNGRPAAQACAATQAGNPRRRC